MEMKVINKQGKATTKKVTLSKSVFGVEPNDHAIYLMLNNICKSKTRYSPS